MFRQCIFAMIGRNWWSTSFWLTPPLQRKVPVIDRAYRDLCELIVAVRGLRQTSAGCGLVIGTGHESVP